MFFRPYIFIPSFFSQTQSKYHYNIFFNFRAKRCFDINHTGNILLWWTQYGKKQISSVGFGYLHMIHQQLISLEIPGWLSWGMSHPEQVKTCLSTRTFLLVLVSFFPSRTWLRFCAQLCRSYCPLSALLNITAEILQCFFILSRQSFRHGPLHWQTFL